MRLRLPAVDPTNMLLVRPVMYCIHIPVVDNLGMGLEMGLYVCTHTYSSLIPGLPCNILVWEQGYTNMGM